MPMISDLTPKTNSNDVDVFAAPQAAFNMRVGVPFEFEDDQGIRMFRISLNEFTVVDDANAPVVGKLIWNDNKDNASFYSHEVLPSGKKLTARVKVGFEQWQSTKWVMVYTAGVKAEEFKEVTFTTGKAPDVIPVTNVEYTYPVMDQRFFLKDETKNGYILLKRGQSYLFSTDYKHEIQVASEAEGVKSLPFSYDAGTNRLNYTLPDLSFQSGYTVNVVTLNKGDNASPVVMDQQTQIANTEDDQITVTNRQAAGVVRTDVGKSLLAYAFTTSQHGTLAQKVGAITKGRAIAGRLDYDLIDLRYEITGGEPFEALELVGGTFNGGKPMLEPAAALTDAYYLEDMYPVMYRDYPVGGMTVSRDMRILGVPPVRSIHISTAYLTEVEQGNFNGTARMRFPYIYNMPMAYKEDFIDLQNKIVNRYAGSADQGKYSQFINGYYKFIRAGNYTIRIQYVMPDGSKGSVGEFDFYNFIK
jgi:hypothetical protein